MIHIPIRPDVHRHISVQDPYLPLCKLYKCSYEYIIGVGEQALAITLLLASEVYEQR